MEKSKLIQIKGFFCSAADFLVVFFFVFLENSLHTIIDPLENFLKFGSHFRHYSIKLIRDERNLRDFFLVNEIDRLQRNFFLEPGSLTHVQNVAIRHLVGSSEANRETSRERG